jgi:glutamate-1-semialdehyde 2,1-aminomutase
MSKTNQESFYRKALRLTPGGSQTFSRMRGTVGTMRYPAFGVHAKGAYLWASNGERYIDLAGANAAVPLGYNPTHIIEAVSAALGICGTMSLPARDEVEASELLVEAVPFADQVKWVRTGSEAVSGAVRTAQRITGRRRVVRFLGSYHGWHPWTVDDAMTQQVSAGTVPLADGIPFHNCDLDDVSAVLVEPPRFEPVTETYRSWLAEVRDECTRAGTLLVFDDVVWGFRFARGGLQEATNIAPDIACFSKALGNGVPVGCFAGPVAVMSETPVSSTFGGETTGLAAAIAVLKIHQERRDQKDKVEVCEELRTIGIALRSMLDDAVAGTPIEVYGTPTHFRFQCRESVGSTEREAMIDGFLDGCLAERILVHRDANNICLPMSDVIVLARISHAACASSRALGDSDE